MARRWWSTGLALVVLMVVAAQADEAKPVAPQNDPSTVKKAAKKPTKPTVKNSLGHLTAVDAKAKTLTVTIAKQPVVFQVTDATEIVISDAVGEFGALKADQKVRVYYVDADQPPLVAKRVLDAGTLAIEDAERAGVEASLDKVDQRTDGAVTTTVLAVTTAQKMKRELLVVTDGATKSLVMKDGKEAALDAFKAGDTVMVAVRRTAGKSMHLKALADPATFRAFLALSTVRGKVTVVSAGNKGLTLAVAGEKEPVPVQWMKTTTFFTGGKLAAVCPFKVGDEVTVKYAQRVKGVIHARAAFAPDSWQAYAEAVKAP